MNVLSNIVNSWWSITFWAATDAPKYRDGWISMLPLAVFVTLVSLAIVYLERREKRNSAGMYPVGEEQPQTYTLPADKPVVTDHDDDAASSDKEKP